MIIQAIKAIFSFLRRQLRRGIYAIAGIIVVMGFMLAAGKYYQKSDRHEHRGAVAISDGHLDESYTTPTYLEQGWEKSDSLWFYNTTQGSALIPYDFFMVLELKGSQTLFRDNSVFDKYRYLPQEASKFNPDSLAVGFVKDSYTRRDVKKERDYIGYTCAACHTGQVNYQGKAIRIDGGPAMADMDGYLKELQASMEDTLADDAKRQRFVDAVIARDNNFSDERVILDSLAEWTLVIQSYNAINHSNVHYGYARLDAFGRIYNRVLQHVVNRDQLKEFLLLATRTDGKTRILTQPQVDKVLEPIEDNIVGNRAFAVVVKRLISDKDGLPGLNPRDVLRLKNLFFNEPNAPVSYPFLWDITHSDYVQWNALANNASAGPLGRNAGEVTGVFALLDWTQDDKGLNIGAKIAGLKDKSKEINFRSSIDLTNLKRLEDQLRSLQSPLWPEDILGKIDREQAAKGEIIYEQYCRSCHQIIDRENWKRVAIAQMSSLDEIGTDRAMAENSVNYSGRTGNFENTYQSTDVGTAIMGEQAPVAMILTATTKGVVATPDADKWIVRRWLDWLYVLVSSIADNEIKNSIKQGTYEPDTTAEPFRSLLAYKARPLNGIWATGPYLHNGSVPTLYDLLLPKKRDGDPDDGEYRPDEFWVGTREFDPTRVGFVSVENQGSRFITDARGNHNTGHEYAAGNSPQPDANSTVLPALNVEERLQLLEFLKTL